MKTEFTRREMEQYLSDMALDNDVVRLVDPLDRRVSVNIKGSANGSVCSMVWGRCGRCENCTSLRALQSRNSAYKMEVMNGQTYWILSRYVSVDGKPNVAELVKNVTDSLMMDSDQRDEVGKLIREYNEQLITDSLTGAYNRRFLEEHFVPSLSCCHEKELAVNLAFLDVDCFKSVNDQYGHAAGDTLLRDIVRFWKLHFNSREKGSERLVVRLGGDELLIVACGIPQERFEEEIAGLDSQMRKICYLGDGGGFSFDYSLGAASSTELGGGWTWDELLQLADQRMYRNKAERKTQKE